MSYTLRILQRFDPRQEQKFMALEEQFAALERKNPNLPKGRRMKPFSGAEPCNTLVWTAEFSTLEEINNALLAFSKDPEHERLLQEQLDAFQEVRIEIFENLDFSKTT